MQCLRVLLLLSVICAVTAVDRRHAQRKGHHAKYVEAGVPDEDNKEDIQEEINLTPFVVLTKEMQWKAGVPNYEDPSQGQMVKTFETEKEARKWVYKHTGAHLSINYPMPEGIYPTNGGIAFLEGSGSDAEEGSGAMEDGSGSGSGSDGSAAEDSDAAAEIAEKEQVTQTHDAGYCAECVQKLAQINAKIADVEGKIAARKDGGPITGITATKGEVVDVVIHREGDDASLIEVGGDAAMEDEGSGGSGSDEGSGSDAEAPEFVEAAAFIEKMKLLRKKQHH